MITISKIPDGKTWADAIAQYRSKGMRTNFYATAEEFLPQLQWLSELKFDGGCYLFHEKEKQIDLYFFLEQGRKAEQIPVSRIPRLCPIWTPCGRISAKIVCLRQGRGRSFLVFCASAGKRRYPSSGRLRLRRTAEERALEAVWCRIGLS